MTDLTETEKKELYSADTQHSYYKQQQTNDIYTVNYFLLFFYYIFLTYYTYYVYGSFRYSSLYYRKMIMVLLLFTYPFIVYPVQYYIYSFGTFIVNLVYNNVYETIAW